MAENYKEVVVRITQDEYDAATKALFSVTIVEAAWVARKELQKPMRVMLSYNLHGGPGSLVMCITDMPSTSVPAVGVLASGPAVGYIQALLNAP